MKAAQTPIWGVARRALYPAMLLGAMGGVAALGATDLPDLGAVAIVVALAGAAIWALEAAYPYDRRWRPPRRTLLLDIAHTVVSSQLVSPLVKAGLLLLVADVVRPHLTTAVWPAHWPLAIQVAIAIVVGDLGIYLGHRAMHATRLGWRIHAVHHSPERLHFFASARSHPFNVVVKVFCESGVLLVLGISPEAFSVWLVFMVVNGMLQHSNVDLRTGWLSHVLATCEIHRLHHARDMALSSSNFGNTTMIWDRLFGTFRLPEAPTTEVGIDGCQIPERYGQHLLAPFVLARWEREAPRAER